MFIPAARTGVSAPHEQSLFQAIQRGNLVGLGQRRVIENRVAEIFNSSPIANTAWPM